MWVLLLAVLYSFALLGGGIWLGRSQRPGEVTAPPSAREPAPAQVPYVTVRALVLGAGAMEKVRKTAGEAAKVLRQRFPQHEVFELVRGRDRYVCVGKFPVDAPPPVQEEVKRLRESVAALSFGSGREKTRFDKAECWTVQP